MMAKLTPPRGKFGHLSGQVRQRNCPNLLLYSKNFVVGIAKGQENVTALTLHMDYPSWFFGLQFNQNETEFLNCLSFRLAFCVDLFIKSLLGLPNPLMPNNLSHLYQTDKAVLNQRANG